MPFDVTQKTLEQLEWPLVLERLVELAGTPHGRAAIAPGPELFCASEREMRERLAATREALAVLESAGPLPSSGAHEVEPALQRASKGGTLEADELLRIAGVVRALGAVRRFIVGQAEHAPSLAERAEGIEAWGSLGAEIDATIEPGGQVRDDASPALAAARRDATRITAEIDRQVQGLLQRSELQPYLSDQWSTVRNDRTVLPVRADARRQVPGIVHDASRSGSTVFIEPQVLVDLNNRHKEAELLAAQEVRRILRDLSEGVAGAADDLRAGLEALGALDFAFARARHAQELEAVEPEIGNAGVLRLPQLRHPLIPADESVPNDVHVGEGFTVLVLSGPNAGGKTVAMKSAALALLFARAGLFVPAQAPARVDRFDALLADIGDAQDIREHLSTFSAHMANLARIVARADAGTLVILDELGVGTDPGEGAAIAQAVLETLADADARIFVTTHYGLLKEIAEVDSRFQNAAVEFDPRTLEPTYRLRHGNPGNSSAAAVAARMGMRRDVLERADALLSRADRRLDRVLSELATSRATLEHERADAQRLADESQAVRDEYTTRLEQLRDRREKLYRELRADLDRAFRDAHDQVAGVVRTLQAAPSSRDAADARTRLLELEEELRDAAPTPPADEAPREEALDWNRAQAGDAVVVQGAGRGSLEALPDRKGRVAVRVGGARLVVPRERVSADATAAPAAPPRRVATPTLPGGGSRRIDLRGERVEAALDRLEEILDAAAAAGDLRVEIVHGIGTGALRAAVREHLARAVTVTKVVDAEPDQGGDGVTFAELGLD